MHARVACNDGVEAMTNVIVGLDQDEREHEVEITPEMIEAGCCELVDLDVERWNGAEVAEKVFRAMFEASRIPASTV